MRSHLSTDCNTDEDYDVCSDQPVADVCCLRCILLLGELDCPFDQEWLAKVESDEAESGWHDSQYGPFQLFQCHSKERMGTDINDYRNQC